MVNLRMPEGILHAERAEVHSKQPHVYAPGRVCDEPSCKTRLSIYNNASTCAVHGRFADVNKGHRVHRGRRSAAQSVAA
jgi:hypothetical protein